MKTIMFALRKSRIDVTLSIFAGLISGGCHAALLAVINHTLQQENPASRIDLALAFAVLCLIVPAARVLSQYRLNKLSELTTLELRMELCKQVIGAPLRQIEGLGSHRLLAVFNNDIGSLVSGLAFIPSLVANLTVIIGSLIYMGWLSPLLLAGTLIMMFLGTLSHQWPMRGARRRQRLAREEHDNLYYHFSAMTQGIKELKLHDHRRQAFRSLYHATGEKLRSLNMVARTLFGVGSSWGQMITFVLIGIILFVASGLFGLSKEILVGYSLILLYIRGSIQVILERLPDLSQASISIRKLEELGLSLTAQATEPDAEDEIPEPTWKSLELAGITRAYHDQGQEDEFVLGPVDLTFEPGELVFVVGGNGSGKTTLVKMLVGLYAPEAGEIRLDGVPIADQNRDDYRQHFAVVFSDFFVFESLLGLEVPDLDEKAKGYLTQLQLDTKIRIEDGALSSTDLSQGQRKRLALLTAYLEDRPIYVFDEWAADQDPHFKEIFYHKLLPELKQRGKSVFVISHDDRYYHLADRIIKLDYGQIELDRRQDEKHLVQDILGAPH